MADISSLDLGKLLRLDEMVTQAAQTEAVRDSAGALVHAYDSLRHEVIEMLKAAGLIELHNEAFRLFQPLESPAPFRTQWTAEDQVRLASAAEEALIRLKLLGGWIKGLIRELTLEQTMQLEAEAKARLAAKPPTGFSS